MKIDHGLTIDFGLFVKPKILSYYSNNLLTLIFVVNKL